MHQYKLDLEELHPQTGKNEKKFTALSGGRPQKKNRIFAKLLAMTDSRLKSITTTCKINKERKKLTSEWWFLSLYTSIDPISQSRREKFPQEGNKKKKKKKGEINPSHSMKNEKGKQRETHVHMSRFAERRDLRMQRENVLDSRGMEIKGSLQTLERISISLSSPLALWLFTGGSAAGTNI